MKTDWLVLALSGVNFVSLFGFVWYLSGRLSRIETLVQILAKRSDLV